MHALVLLPDRNSPGKKDWSGVFHPEAVAFRETHVSPAGFPHASFVQIDMSESKPHRRFRFFSEIADHSKPPLNCLAWFGHGLPGGLPQVGVGVKDVDHFASVFASSKVEQTVILYACSAGKGPGIGGNGGFADALRDALCRAGSVTCRVVAHSTAGHATRNPYVRFFEGEGSSHGGTGGRWVVALGSTLWKRWVKALRDTDLRFRFPFLSIAEIHEEVAG